MKTENIQRWQKIEVLLASVNPHVLNALRPPASISDLREAENIMGLVFPEDVRDAYLRHDGVDWVDELQARPYLFPRGMTWMPLERVLSEWRSHSEMFFDFRSDDYADYLQELDEHPDDRVRRYGPLLEWIPIGDGSGCTVCIDLLPGPAGVVGQLVHHDFVMGSQVIAKGFGDYLDLLISGLANGTAGWPDGRYFKLALGGVDAAELARSISSAEAVCDSPVSTTEVEVLPPKIAQQPVAASADAGADAKFAVSATGGADLRYQWFRNGLALPGGDASEVQIPAKAASIGESFQITVQVSNADGAVTSEPVAMTVTHPIGGVLVEQAVEAAKGGRLSVGKRAALNIYLGALAVDATVRMVAEQADRLGIEADCFPIGDAVTVDTGGVAFATPLWLEVRMSDDVAEGRVVAMLELGETTRAAGDAGAATTPVLQVLGLSARHSQYGTLVAGLQRDGRYLLAQVHECDITDELE